MASSEQSIEQLAYDIFSKADKDGNGILSKSELKKLLHDQPRLRHLMRTDQGRHWADFWAEIDENQDGKIELQEVVDYFKRAEKRQHEEQQVAAQAAATTSSVSSTASTSSVTESSTTRVTTTKVTKTESSSTTSSSYAASSTSSSASATARSASATADYVTSRRYLVSPKKRSPASSTSGTAASGQGESKPQSYAGAVKESNMERKGASSSSASTTSSSSITLKAVISSGGSNKPELSEHDRLNADYEAAIRRGGTTSSGDQGRLFDGSGLILAALLGVYVLIRVKESLN